MTEVLQKCLVWRPLFDLLSILHVSSAPPSIIRAHASFFLTTLSPLPPTTHPLAAFPSESPGTGLICGLRVQRGIDGGRIGGNWKKAENMKVSCWRKQEEGNKQGRGAQEKETAREWSNDLAAPAIIKGRGGRSAKTQSEREREGKNGRKRKRESLLTWPQGIFSFFTHSSSLSTPIAHTQYTNLPN